MFSSPETPSTGIPDTEVAKCAADAFALSEDECRHLGSTMLGEFMGRRAKGENWKDIIADMEREFPEYDVRGLIESVSDDSLLPWKEFTNLPKG